MSSVEAAHQLIAAGQPQRAIAELERSAAKNDAASWFELGILFFAGKYVSRDLARARDCFRRAGEAGDTTGGNIYISFLAIGVGGEADWGAAVESLRQFARNYSPAAEQLSLLERMNLSPTGDPLGEIHEKQLSDEPEIVAFERLFSLEECAYLISRARPLLQPSTIVDPETGQLRPHPVRTSYSAVFPWVSEDIVIHALNRRIAKASRTAVGNGEPLQVLRYHTGQQFRPHVDAFDAIDNQRVLTMLVYLNEAYVGGETIFTRIGLTFAGRTGDGLLFRNALPNGAPNPMTQHAGLPVTRGEKFLASRWIRERPLVPV